MRDSQGGGESYPAEGRILLPFYPAWVRGQEKAATVAAKSGQFTADEMEKGQFLRGNRRNLTGEGVVRKISSPQRVASVSNLCSGQGTRVTGSGSVIVVGAFDPKVQRF